MDVTTSDEKTKELLTEILVEMIQDKREEFYEIVREAIEEVGLRMLSRKEDKIISSVKTKL